MWSPFLLAMTFQVLLCLGFTTLRENPYSKRLGFHCVNGTSKLAIPWQWRCDGQPDCPGEVDEKNCSYWNPRQVKKNRKTRVCDGGTLYVEDARCNSHMDCRDYSDERDCPERQCFPPDTTIFTATNQFGEGQDYPRVHMRSSCWKSFDGCVCMKKEWLCDGEVDTPDASDEAGMECSEHFRARHASANKNPTIFRCFNGEFVYAQSRCNKFLDCTDFTDEHFCPDLVLDQYDRFARRKIIIPPSPPRNLFAFKWTWDGVDPQKKSSCSSDDITVNNA